MNCTLLYPSELYKSHPLHFTHEQRTSKFEANSGPERWAFDLVQVIACRTVYYDETKNGQLCGRGNWSSRFKPPRSSISSMASLPNLKLMLLHNTFPPLWHYKKLHIRFSSCLPTSSWTRSRAYTTSCQADDWWTHVGATRANVDNFSIARRSTSTTEKPTVFITCLKVEAALKKEKEKRPHHRHP